MFKGALDYRERIRKVKEEEKLKWAMLLHGADIRKPPRVIRETESVEMELDNVVPNPLGIGQRPPDFRGMTERVLRHLSIGLTSHIEPYPMQIRRDISRRR